MTGEIIKWADLSEELQECFNYCEFNGDEDFEVVEEGDWVCDYKYEICTNVFKRKSDGKYFAHDQSRSGSYHTDYYYNDPEDLYEVERKEVVTIQYVMVE